MSLISRCVHLKTLTIAASLNHSETEHVNYMTAMPFFDYIDINIPTSKDK